MLQSEGREFAAKAKRVAKHVEKSVQKYGDRAEEVAWRVVHSELPHSQREKKQ